MMNRKTMDQKDAYYFLESLKEDGVEEIYWPKLKARVGKSPSSQGQPIQRESSSGVKGQLLALRETALNCRLCGELAQSRKSVVFGSGNVKAKLMFVGEAPGHEEDLQGLPFVGPAGQLLTKIIESIGLTRNQVFIANVLKCRPPGNRQPHPEEVMNCQGYLYKQIELIHPKVLCALGTFASRSLLNTEKAISELRGNFFDYSRNPSIKLICTYHPAYLLRNPGEKRKVWEDMQKIMKALKAV